MSSEIFGNCRKVLKTTFQHFLNFVEIFGNCLKSSEKSENVRNQSSQNDLPTL